MLCVNVFIPPPLWGRAGWGVARRRESVNAFNYLATPTPTPPHKGEGK